MTLSSAVKGKSSTLRKKLNFQRDGSEKAKLCASPSRLTRRTPARTSVATAAAELLPSPSEGLRAETRPRSGGKRSRDVRTLAVKNNLQDSA
eukprot:1659794-Pleurochrysis_carterae.AAC.1